MTPMPWPARLARGLRLVPEVCVEQHDITIAKPLGTAGALRIVFASDFHAGPFTAQEAIDQAVELMADAAPHVLLLGGDFVSLRSEYAIGLAERLGAIPAPLGRYAVLGNHDYWADGARVAEHLRRAGIDVITNRNVGLPDPFGNVSICGLDDHTSGEPHADAALRGSRDVRIVLMHAPSGLLDIGERSFDLALCGHTHGGQVSLASGRPLIVGHGLLSRQFNAGRFNVDEASTLIVSRGVGCTAMPFRFNAPPAVMTCAVYGSPG